MAHPPLQGGRVVIVGGGIIGASIAFHLAKLGHPNVTLLERGRLGEGATAYATGGIRHQFSSRVNVELVHASLPFWIGFEERTGAPLDFRRHGYLFLHAAPETWAAFCRNAHMQRDVGAEVQVLPPDRVADVFPGVRTDDLLGATYSPGDGSASPADAMSGYVRGARRGGVEIRQHTAFGGLLRDRVGRIRGVRTSAGDLDAETVVLAAGPQTREVGVLCGVDLPVRPHSRQAFATARLPGLGPHLPLAVDLPTGAYLHPEASGTAVIGGNDRVVPSSDRAMVDWSRTESLVEALAHRFPGLLDVQITRGWAGLREMTPDDLGIVDRLDDTGRLWVAAGFSGHGFMQSPAVGHAVAQLLMHGRSDLDLTGLRLSRFAADQAESPETAVF